METTKAQLRREFLEKRDKLNRSEISEKSRAIKEKLFLMPEFANAKIIFTYVSAGSEVFTHDLILEAMQMGKKISVPSLDLKKCHMFPSKINSFSELEENKKTKILEPKKEFIRKVEPENLDLILVPGIVFDLHGHRIGSGKAYYDKYLGSLKQQAPAIGLAFEIQIIDKFPKEPHDIRMDRIITEKRVIASDD